jgi:hypothetical protein
MELSTAPETRLHGNLASESSTSTDGQLHRLGVAGREQDVCCLGDWGDPEQVHSFNHPQPLCALPVPVAPGTWPRPYPTPPAPETCGKAATGKELKPFVIYALKSLKSPSAGLSPGIRF